MKQGYRPARVLAVFLGLVLGPALMHGCGSSTPTTPATPKVTTTPSPTPVVSPTPPPVNQPGYPASCQGIQPGTGIQRGCSRGNSNFLGDVRAAVELAEASTYRDPNTGETVNIVGDNNKILVVSAYLKTVIDYLDKKGLCAAWDGEISVRDSTGAYNENFNIMASSGAAWYNYTVTCTPALPIPPLEPAAISKDPDCKLPGSRAFSCLKESPVYDGDVYASLDELIAEDQARNPTLIFDFNDHLGGISYGWKIKDDSLYVSELTKKLKKKGYCVFYDGDEFNVKRRTNIFSEKYDLTKAEGYSIRLNTATCRDADL